MLAGRMPSPGPARRIGAVETGRPAPPAGLRAAAARPGARPAGRRGVRLLRPLLGREPAPARPAARPDRGRAWPTRASSTSPPGEAAGRGTILALPHLGGWEWAGIGAGISGHPISVVVEALEPPDVFEWFVAFRERLGMQVIPIGPGAAAACSRALRRQPPAVPAVRPAGRRGRRRWRSSSSASAPSAGRPGDPGVCAPGRPCSPPRCTSRAADAHLGVVRPPLDLARPGASATTSRPGPKRWPRARGLIRRAPTQWHLMQPNWPSDARSASPRIVRVRASVRVGWCAHTA